MTDRHMPGIKRVISAFFSAAVTGISILSFICSVQAVPEETLPPESRNITERADFLYGITWTAQTDFTGWKGLCTYRKGETYHLPYAQSSACRGTIYWQISVDRFLHAASDANSAFYRLKGRYNCPYYGIDCSGFVSYCWDTPQRASTATWAELDATELGLCTPENIPDIEAGDALNIVDGDNSHVVLISRINQDGTFEVTQQSYPDMRRNIYTAEQLAANYNTYTIYRRNHREQVSPPQESSYAMLSESLGMKPPVLLADSDWQLLSASAGRPELSGDSPADPQPDSVWRLERSRDGSCAVYTDSDRRALVITEQGLSLVQLAEDETPPKNWQAVQDQDGRFTLTAPGFDQTLYIWQTGLYEPLDDPEILHYTNLGADFTAVLTDTAQGKYLSAANGNAVLRTSPDSGALWRFVHYPNDTYVIYHAADGKVLTGDAGVFGCQVRVSDFYNGDCQHWFLVSVEDDIYYLKRYHLHCALDTSSPEDALRIRETESDGTFTLHLYKTDTVPTVPADTGTEADPSSEQSAGTGVSLPNTGDDTAGKAAVFLSALCSAFVGFALCRKRNS